MPKRVPIGSIVVQREGKNFIPPVGKPFDFTAEELADIEKVAPDAVRKVINEEAGSETAKPEALTAEQNKAQTLEVMANLIKNKDNLNSQGALNLDTLNAALKDRGLTKVSAAERDTLVTEIKTDDL